jgi:hypothetical protein
MSQGGLLLAGCVVCCGAVLVLAGLSKLQRGVRGIDGGAAIRRALRMPRRRWRRAELAIGGVECLTGALVCTGVRPVAASAAMAALGATSCVLLLYIYKKRFPGDCGCLTWRKTVAAEKVTWRAIARAAMVLGAGTGGAVAGTASAGAFRHPWFYPGVAAAALVFVLLSTRLMARTPVCHRRLWRPARAGLRALAAHDTFAAMAASAGPFADVAGYRRDGCTEEFWLSPVGGPGGARAGGPGRPRAAVFRVSYPAPDGPPAVHASLRDARAMDAGWPSRAMRVRESLPNH